MLDQGHAEQALPELLAAIEIRPHFESCEEALASAYENLGKAHRRLHIGKRRGNRPWQRDSHSGRRVAAGHNSDASLRNGREALSLAQAARNLAPSDDADMLDTLPQRTRRTGSSARIALAQQALGLAEKRGNSRWQAQSEIA